MKKLLINFIFLLSSFDFNILSIAPKNFDFSRALRTNSRLDGYHKFKYLNSQTTITEPGIYLVPNNVVFTPQFDGDSYIVIDSDNVMVDLNLKSIVQDPNSIYENVVGIKIAAGHSNIIVRNGCVKGMSGYGIRVQDSSEMLDFHDMVIVYCGIAGVFLDGLSANSSISNTLFLNLTINEVQSNKNQPVYGIYGQYCQIMNIDNVAMGNTGSLLSTVYGLKFENSSSIRIKSCVASDNYSSGLGAIGYDFDNCNSVMCLDCVASQNVYTGTQTNSLTVGYHISNSENIFLEACTSVGNVSTYTCAGILTENSNNTGAFKSDFIGNKSFYSNAAGIVVSNSINNIFKECLIGGNNSGLNGIGCWILSSTGVGVSKCEIDGDLAQTGTAYGILVDNSYSCFVLGNMVAGHIGGAGGFGILDTLGTFTVNRYFSNICSLNTKNFSDSLLDIPIFNRSFDNIIGTFENASL